MPAQRDFDPYDYTHLRRRYRTAERRARDKHLALIALRVIFWVVLAAGCVYLLYALYAASRAF
jgi:hypothetical protein